MSGVSVVRWLAVAVVAVAAGWLVAASRPGGDAPAPSSAHGDVATMPGETTPANASQPIAAPEPTPAHAVAAATTGTVANGKGDLFSEIVASATPVSGSATYTPMFFDQLADYDYRPFGEGEGTTESALAQIPEKIRALNGHLIETAGFMIPVEADSTGVHSFLLVKDQTLCCFGVLPRPNDWMLVTMAEGRTADYVADRPVRISGRLTVGPTDDEHGAAIVYRMEGHRFSPPR